MQTLHCINFFIKPLWYTKIIVKHHYIIVRLSVIKYCGWSINKIVNLGFDWFVLLEDTLNMLPISILLVLCFMIVCRQTIFWTVLLCWLGDFCGLACFLLINTIIWRTPKIFCWQGRSKKTNDSRWQVIFIKVIAGKIKVFGIIFGNMPWQSPPFPYDIGLYNLCCIQDTLFLHIVDKENTIGR